MKGYRDREGRRAETNADQVVQGSVDGGSVCGWGISFVQARWRSKYPLLLDGYSILGIIQSDFWVAAGVWRYILSGY